MKIIDLSLPIEDGLPSDPPPQIPRIEYLRHKDTAAMMASYFHEAISTEDLPEGNGWAIENLRLSTHSGTHLDAPYHFYPTMNGGERAWTIDEVPLEWCVGNGVKLDFSHKPDGYKVSADDLRSYFVRIGYEVRPGDIVLIRSGAAEHWGTARYLLAGVGMSAEATHWLIDRGVRVMGTDGWSWDVPLPLEAEEFAKNGDPSIIWEGHRVGREKAYCHLEKLTNLHKLPDTGFRVSCLPVSIKGAGAGRCRAVSFTDE
jgi:kynurenine formamidase